MHSYLFEVNVIGQLHVLRVDAKNLQTTSRVRNTDIDFTIKSAESPQCRVDGVGSICSRHNYYVRTSLHAIHQSQQLRDDTTFDFSVGLTSLLAFNRTRSHVSTHLFTLRRNRIIFIDENDRRRVLLGLFKRLSQITFTLPSHLTHNLRTVDQEEKRSCFVRNRTHHERLTRTGRAKQEDTAWGLDTDRLE